METKKKLDTLTMVEMALLLAITIIMGTTPLGTIRTPFLSVSLVTIPVAIGAIIVGPIGGIVCGLGFGFTSLYNALIGASGMMSALMSVSPFFAVFTILVPRFLEGLCTAYLFKLFKKLKTGKAAYFLGAICCPLLNTLFFMGCIVIFFYSSDYIQGLVGTLGVSNPISFIIALVGVQGLIEAVSCCILAGAISLALHKALKR
ncbi:MAG: ECF transporter S component [Lachnospiraceae bacterium]|nr:ECF transporter S component [Lachnospiraceae bacterium]MDD5854337.1 ECF transporter S component [Lachnospiraceae bacterium]